jgi:hypothetical protein
MFRLNGNRKEQAPRKAEAKSFDVELTPVRTSIDEIEAVGFELSEEHLRIVSGSRPSAGTTSSVGATDDD